MTEPAKDEAELLERMAKGAMCAGIIICHNQKSCIGCFAKADAALAAIRAAGWAVVPARLIKDMEYDALRAENARLRGALADMHAGWRYIRLHYGDLSGVGGVVGAAAARAALEVKP